MTLNKNFVDARPQKFYVLSSRREVGRAGFERHYR